MIFLLLHFFSSFKFSVSMRSDEKQKLCWTFRLVCRPHLTFYYYYDILSLGVLLPNPPNFDSLSLFLPLPLISLSLFLPLSASASAQEQVQNSYCNEAAWNDLKNRKRKETLSRREFERSWPRRYLYRLINFDLVFNEQLNHQYLR